MTASSTIVAANYGRRRSRRIDPDQPDRSSAARRLRTVRLPAPSCRGGRFRYGCDLNSALSRVAPLAIDKYMALVGMLTLLTAGLLLLARIFKLGSSPTSCRARCLSVF